MTAAALISELHQFCYLFYFFANVISAIDRFMDGILMALFTTQQVARVAGCIDQTCYKIDSCFWHGSVKGARGLPKCLDTVRLQIYPSSRGAPVLKLCFEN